jgi:hypothetical protein
MTNIFIIGYYGHNNIGDEQYKITFDYILRNYLPYLQKYHIKFIDCDRLKNFFFEENDIIILGGGDILNDYFLDEINDKFKEKKNKIIAISVGLPYNDILINTNKMNIIDYIFIRTQQDVILFNQHYRPNRVIYLPDISYILNYSCKKTLEKNSTKAIILNDKLSIIKKNGKKVLTFCLNRHIYTKSSEETYKQITLEFSKIIELLIKKGYFIVLLPFNTSKTIKEYDMNMENDILIHNDVYRQINDNLKIDVINIDFTLTVNETFALFDYFDLVIPMRFHACLFSIYKKIPMLPIFTTKKIKNFLLDIKWNIFYELDTDQKDLPIMLNSNIFFDKFKELSDQNRQKKLCFFSKYKTIDVKYQKNQKLLSDSCSLFEGQLKYEIQTIIDVITIPYNKDMTHCAVNEEVIIEKIILKIKDYMGDKTVNDLDFGSDFFKDPIKQNNVVSMVSYYLTNGFDSKYNHGLSEKMFNCQEKYNYKDEWSWILKDKGEPIIENNHNGIFNMNFVDQLEYSDSHRSGWRYIIDSIKHLNNENSDVLYLDFSLDKTFHWKSEINKLVGILPYTHDWAGFIHHTFDITFSEYNNVKLFENQLFIESLKFCKCLFVFSYHLKARILENLKFTGYTHIQVHVLCHPTEITNIVGFSWKKFIENPNKKLVNVGGWLRNIFSFYNLTIPKEYKFCIGGDKKNFLQNTISTLYHKKVIGTIQKVALKGREMDNYYPQKIDEGNILCSIEPEEFSFKSKKSCSFEPHKSCSFEPHKSCSRNSFENNNWNRHCQEHTKEICKNVKVIERLSNEDYDDLLTENIVFLNLVDAAAVNTIIECIIRNTPIIVNRIPAVVEMLGENYPLYYGDVIGNTHNMNQEIIELLLDTRQLKSAHKYLSHMDKTKYTVNYFINDVSTFIKKSIISTA